MKKLIFLIVFNVSYIIQAQINELLKVNLHTLFLQMNSEFSEEEFINEFNSLQKKQFSNKDVFNLNVYKTMFFLSDDELFEIGRYLKKHPTENCICFLNRLDLLNQNKVFLVQFLFSSNYLNKVGKSSLNQVFKIKDVFGYDSYFEHVQSRTNYNFSQGNFTSNLSIEKDLLEQNKLDYLSFNLSYTDDKQKIIIGDFELKLGSGISLNQHFLQPNISDNVFSNSRIKSHNGNREYDFFRGIAFEKRINKNIKTISFLSNHKIDASLNNDTIQSFLKSGIHSTTTELKYNKNIKQFSGGAGLLFTDKYINSETFFHYHRYNKLLSNRNKSNFYSLYQKLSLSLNRIQFLGEIDWQNLNNLTFSSHIQYHLGNKWYYKTGFLVENIKSENYFRKYNDAFTDPEKLFYLRFQFKSKKEEFSFYFQNSKSILDKLKSKKKTLVTSFYRYRFKNKNTLTTYLTNAKTLDKNLLRFKLRLSIQKRGKFYLVNEIHLKTLDEIGGMYHVNMRYLTSNKSFRLGCYYYYQNRGAFYLYESDVRSLGYLRSYYNNGFVNYFKFVVRKNKFKFESKIRSYKDNTDKQLLDFSTSFIYKL